MIFNVRAETSFGDRLVQLGRIWCNKIKPGQVGTMWPCYFSRFTQAGSPFPVSPEGSFFSGAKQAIGSVCLHKSKIHDTDTSNSRASRGRKFQKEKELYSKEFAYRMCARRPTSVMPKPFLCCERAFCCSMVVM